jgi:dTDP-4-amino-4,6-dideoxygalactose transaminase/dienelactone hydrolase
VQHTRLDRFVAEAPRRSSEAHRAPIRKVVERLAALHAVELTTVASEAAGVTGLRGNTHVFAHERRSSIRARLLVPAGAGPHPTVLVSPGRNATLDRVTGAAPPDHPDRNVAEQLCRAGFATLTLDHGLNDGAGSALSALAILAGESLLGALVEDTLAALAWLRVHPDVDADRIGLFGHSLGAAVVLHTALVDPDPLPVCAASHLGTYQTLYGRLRTGPDGGALPGILRYADMPDLYGALAPAPLQLQYGLRDPYLDAADAAVAGDAVVAAYAAVNAKHHVQVEAVDMGHGTDVARAVAFFADAFARPRDGQPRVPAGRVVFDPHARTEVLDRVDAALATGSLTLGPFGRQLEALAGTVTGCPTAAVASGSAALEIALRIVGVAGRTVLVQSNTFFATAASAIRAGATVDFVDVELDGLGLDPEHLRQVLARHRDVAAVVPVHIAGVPSPALDAVLAECAARGIDVIEDAAHALGSTLAGRPAGSLGRLGAFSLYPTKVATSGEGGLLTCPEQADLESVHRYRDQGKASFEANVHAVLGSNWRMSDVHAAVGIAHLERLDAMLVERREQAARYDALLADVPGIRPYRAPAGVVANHYKYVAFLEEGIDRDDLRRRLRERHGVELSGGVYDTLAPAQPYFRGAYDLAAYPRARWFAQRHVCLPLFLGLTARQQEAVAVALRAEVA